MNGALVSHSEAAHLAYKRTWNTEHTKQGSFDSPVIMHSSRELPLSGGDDYSFNRAVIMYSSTRRSGTILASTIY
ncbi:hypothetical protein BD769DRAFT_1667136 [Suillus cothurnatus]|nr:hypothetical protein BD769DRAFT_1667136 [Suillus cothurnatus]